MREEVKAQPDAERVIAERYEKLGALAKRKDGSTMFLHPHSSPAAVADDPLPELDVAFLGKGLANYPPRVKDAAANRLEELRDLCKVAGVAEHLLRDDPEQGDGFADRLMTITSSDETRDRYGDRILVDGSLTLKDGTTKKFGKGWQTKTYTKQNPVFMLFHEYSPFFSSNPWAGIPAGQAVDVFTDQKGPRKRLRKTILWDDGSSQPMAPLVRNGYRARSMRSFSVGFKPIRLYMPADAEERAALDLGEYGVIFGESELLETSAVSIPANPMATDEKGWDVEVARGLATLADQVDGSGLAPEYAYAIRSFLPKSLDGPSPRSTSAGPGLIFRFRSAVPDQHRAKIVEDIRAARAAGLDLVLPHEVEVVDLSATARLDNVVEGGATLREVSPDALALGPAVKALTAATQAFEAATRALVQKAAAPVAPASEDDDARYDELLSLTKKTEGAATR